MVARGDITMAILSHRWLTTRDEWAKEELEREFEQELEVHVQFTLHVLVI